MNVIDPEVISVDWSVDGALVKVNGGPASTSPRADLASGSHTIAAKAYDNADDTWVRYTTGECLDPPPSTNPGYIDPCWGRDAWKRSATDRDLDGDGAVMDARTKALVVALGVPYSVRAPRGVVRAERAAEAGVEHGGPRRGSYGAAARRHVAVLRCSPPGITKRVRLPSGGSPRRARS